MSKPIVLIMGGPDVDLRLELMGRLREEFEMVAAGTAPALASRFAAAGFDYRYYPLHRTVHPLSDLVSITSILRLCRALRPDVVHTFDAKPGVWGRLAARWAGVPAVVGTIPGLGSLYTNERFSTRLTRTFYEPLQRWACRVSDLTIFQNRDDRRQFVAAKVVAESKTMIIPGSGIPTDRYAPEQVPGSARAALRDELGIGSGETLVTMVSRVIRTKGVLEFMAAAEAVRRRHPNTRFLLVGPSDDESLERLTASEVDKLKAAVTWPGPRRDIPAVLAISDVFVLPSAYREGIPRVLLEAASMELPIVTTDSPGCNEVVEDGLNGFLVRARDAGALERAILRLIEEPDLRRKFGRISRQRAVEFFDLSIIAEQTRSVYRSLLSR